MNFKEVLIGALFKVHLYVYFTLFLALKISIFE